jgi:hypothetical protein
VLAFSALERVGGAALPWTLKVEAIASIACSWLSPPASQSPLGRMGALFSSHDRHAACAKLFARPSRRRCILPLAVDTAGSAPLMTRRFGTAAVVWKRILRPLPSPSERCRCRCSKTSQFAHHCSSGFSLRWPATWGVRARGARPVATEA